MSVIEHPVVDDGLWSTIASHSDSVDREARFPAEAVDGLSRAGLMALGVPADLGGPGGGPAEVVAAVERVASACSSTAMVYVMHAIATQTLIAGAAERGANRDVLREIATGGHLTTLAFSEPATRSHSGRRPRGPSRTATRDRLGAQVVGDLGRARRLVRHRHRRARFRRPARHRALPDPRGRIRDRGGRAVRRPRAVRQRVER